MSSYPGEPGFKEGETSREAAESIAKHASKLRAMALEYITGHPGHTADAVAAALGKHPLAIRPRISELRKKGLVTNEGRGKNPSGKPAHCWKATHAA